MRLKKILVVDDEESICQLIKDSMEATGEFHVTCTSDPFLVEKLCASEKPDLILMDVVMPRRKGSEIVQALKSNDKFSSIPIIIMSGLGEMVYLKGENQWKWLPNRPIVYERGEIETDSHKAASAYGVEEYIEKPFTMDYLIKTVKKILLVL